MNYSFIVDGGAVCIGDLDFDVTSIADNATVHDDVLNAFTVQIGALAGAETGFQGTDPLESTGPISSSILSPIFSLAGADTGMLSYDFESIAGGDWDANARVYLWDGSTQTIVKDFGAADTGPYDISSLYTGSAQYEVRLETQNGEGFRMTGGLPAFGYIVPDQQETNKAFIVVPYS